ncbi:MAG: hypothetical protein JRF49_09505, partial [Deltaproteobacteria bacterium]|nr:hypothetical protein [Deltaproteobacteria bacterium]
MARRGNGGRDPWSKDDDGLGLPPEIEKIFKTITGGFKGGKFNILFIALAAVLLWILFSCAYSVDVEEVGI